MKRGRVKLRIIGKRIKTFADAKETHSLQDASDATGLSIKSIKQLQKFYTFRNFAGISCISFSIRYNIKCM